MELRKAKRFHTVESYASCVCLYTACSCSCRTCVCACKGVAQPSERDMNSGYNDAREFNATGNRMAEYSVENIRF